MESRAEIENSLREAARAHYRMDLSIGEAVRLVASELETYAATLRIYDPQGITRPADPSDARFECGCWFSAVGAVRHPAITGEMCCPVHLKPYGDEPEWRPLPR